MQNKSNLDIDGNDPIVGAEFSSGEWGIEGRLLMSVLQMLSILFVNKAQHRQHWLQCWTLNPGPWTSRDIPPKPCPQPFVLLLLMKSNIACDSTNMYLIGVC
jgi:hypothetical protein